MYFRPLICNCMSLRRSNCIIDSVAEVKRRELVSIMFLSFDETGYTEPKATVSIK